MTSPGTASVLRLVRRVALVLVFLLLLLRPSIGGSQAPVQVADVDVVVVVDRTRSMAALDHAGSAPRITGVVDDLHALADALPAARFAIIAFGAEARLTLPLTTDTASFESGVDTLVLEGPRDGAGSRADRPVAELVRVLQRTEEQRPDRRRVVVYLGDGEDTTSGGTDQTFADAADLVDAGVVLGYGTARGAAMPTSDDLDPDRGLVRTPETGDTAISRADADNLRRIADELGVGFVARTGTGGPGDIAAIADGFDASFADDDVARPGAHDLAWVLGLVLLGLVLLELRAGWRDVWTAGDALLGERSAR